ncbi:hypothetical protein OH458_21390 [Vibrio sp. MarTm2]|uniref:hypothetical protein n=1 Tax=Vibrio sp. MarTm2 TaxID=2998831 RepID=UPI0022CD6C42|nr:hypothetical protein [Vibrio sp. MarTm2]MDA0130621.1 hypothetical protein [Vibrio sp. MarTm2]
MTELKRRFIRLDEISQKTTLSKGDVLDAVEQKKMPLCGVLKSKKMGAIHPTSKSVPAIFNYEGVVRFTESTSFNFAFSGKAQPCTHAIILEPQRITHWQPVKSVFGNVVSADFKLDERVLNQPTVTLIAYTQIQSVQTLDSSLEALTNTFSKSFGLKADDEAQYNPPRYHLKTTPVTVEPAQLRVDLEDIQRVFGVDVFKANALVSVTASVNPVESSTSSNAVPVETSVSNGASTFISSVNERLAPVTCNGSNALASVNPNASNALPSVSSTVKRRLDSVDQRYLTHPLAHVVIRILETHPEVKAITVWNILRQDVNQNEFQREYDTDVLIESMTQDTLSYFGRGEKEKTMSYESFRKNVLAGAKRLFKTSQEVS